MKVTVNKPGFIEGKVYQVEAMLFDNRIIKNEDGKACAVHHRLCSVVPQPDKQPMTQLLK